MKISPELASSSPAIIRMVVVFPQPDGPSRTKNSLSAIVRLKSSTAMNLPHRLWIFLSSIDAIIGWFPLCKTDFAYLCKNGRRRNNLLTSLILRQPSKLKK
jgi:hypothetical protein